MSQGRRARKQTVPWGLPTLSFQPQKTHYRFPTSRTEIINVCCFKPLSLGSFAVEATGNSFLIQSWAIHPLSGAGRRGHRSNSNPGGPVGCFTGAPPPPSRASLTLGMDLSSRLPWCALGGLCSCPSHCLSYSPQPADAQEGPWWSRSTECKSGSAGWLGVARFSHPYREMECVCSTGVSM